MVEQRAKDQLPTVIVIDDDPGVRDSLGKLLGAVGFQPTRFCERISRGGSAARTYLPGA